MGIVIDNHRHINSEVPGRKYFPWQQTWLVCMEWAYGGRSPTKGIPPYERDPNALYPRQGLRFADPEGTHTIAAMDAGGIDMCVILPIDYDFSWGSQSDIQIEEKHEHQAQMVAKYPGRFVSFGGPDPRRAGVARDRHADQPGECQAGPRQRTVITGLWPQQGDGKQNGHTDKDGHDQPHPRPPMMLADATFQTFHTIGDGSGGTRPNITAIPAGLAMTTGAQTGRLGITPIAAGRARIMGL